MSFYQKTKETEEIAKIFSSQPLEKLERIKSNIEYLMGDIIRQKTCERKKSEVKKIQKAISQIIPNAKNIKIVSFKSKNVNIWAEETEISTLNKGEGWHSVTIQQNDFERKKGFSKDVVLKNKSNNLRKYKSIFKRKYNVGFPIVFANQIEVCPFCGRFSVCHEKSVYHPILCRWEIDNSDLDLNLEFLRDVKTNFFQESHVYRRCYQCHGKSRIQVLKAVTKNQERFKISEDKIKRIQNKRNKKKNKKSLKPFKPKEKEFIEPVIKQKYLYLMKDEINGAYKIGVSNNPKYREATLASQKPSIKLVGMWAEMGDNERDWHEYFKNERMRGEWFDLTAAQVRFFVSKCQKNLGAPFKELIK